MSLRVGYSFWGFLGDRKIEGGQEVSTPDGNATYSWSVLWELQQRGHVAWSMQRDRDIEGWLELGPDLFGSFSPQKRKDAYLRACHSNGHLLPELDVLLLEWRFPIPGRNTVADRGRDGYQPDLERQTALLEHYGRTKTKIVIWDLDHKLLEEEERLWHPDAIFETSANPRLQHIRRTRVEPPFVMGDLLQHPTLPADPRRRLVYVGSRYERDDVIERYLAPITEGVELWGKWDDEARARWPRFSYHGRITLDGFREAYGTAVACPLLAKKSYLRTGFVTPRPWEALLFGTIPIGLTGHAGILKYVNWAISSSADLDRCVRDMAQWTLVERDQEREEAAHMLGFMDVRHLIDRVEEVVNGSVADGPMEHVTKETGRQERAEKGD